MINGISLTDIFIDCNNPDKLLEFYYNLTEEQYGGDHWVTLLDPEGHPFCFGVDE